MHPEVQFFPASDCTRCCVKYFAVCPEYIAEHILQLLTILFKHFKITWISALHKFTAASLNSASFGLCASCYRNSFAS